MSSILAIKNRTENWRTAVYFSPMFGNKSYKLAELLVGPSKFLPDEVKIELFWSGIRDYRYQEGLSIKDLEEKVVDIYEKQFSKLRTKVLSFPGFSELKEHHYVSNDAKSARGLTHNLIGTELDVILETPKELLIGEVKHESTFGAHGKLVLVHQLIRQYVAASILLELTGVHKTIVPFVVGDSKDHLNKSSQVRFMISQNWLSQKNVLDWEDVHRSQIS